MEDFIKDQIVPTLKFLPFHMAASYFKKNTSAEVAEAKRKLGGFMKGVCHPNRNYEQIKGAGLGWNRADIPFPFDENGELREKYLEWKEVVCEYKENGIRIMAITPNPKAFISAGIDPRLPENEGRVREVALFLLNDLRGIAEVIQVTNEMGVPRFMNPLTLKEAARVIGVQLAEMHRHRGDILIGYNVAMPSCNLIDLMRPWLPYCDYVGIDVYIGSFAPVATQMRLHELMLRYVWSMTGKPVILCEFGYISGGAPKTAGEKREVLRRYGFDSERQARENIDTFMENIKEVNEGMYNYIKRNASGGYADFIFQLDFCNHFYTELPKHTVIKKYPHTPTGQAEFYRDVFPMIAGLPFLLGAFIYCWKDAPKCGYCNQSDCPTETRWGLVDLDGKEKPSYYAVRDALAGIE